MTSSTKTEKRILLKANTMKFVTRENAVKVLDKLRNNGLNAILIGSLLDKKHSNHDIDILIIGNKSKQNINRVKRTLAPFSRIKKTDWGGLFFTLTWFGSIDVFFLGELFRLAGLQNE